MVDDAEDRRGPRRLRAGAEPPRSTPFHTSVLVVGTESFGPPLQSVDDAYFLLETMHKGAEPVSIGSINAVLLGCAALGDVGRAIETFDAIAEIFELSPRCTFIQKPLYEIAVVFMEVLTRDGGFCSARSYAAVVESWLQPGGEPGVNMDGALSFISEIQQNEVKPVRGPARICLACKNLPSESRSAVLRRGP